MQEYDHFPDESRVWIYQSDRQFTPEEIAAIVEKASMFVMSWSAHGASLTGRIDVIYDQFVRITVDESAAGVSGCSIDKATKFIRRLEQDFGVRMLDSLAVGYRDGQSIKCCSREEFQHRIAKGQITDATLVFNNLVETKADFESRWEVPITQSWQRELLQG